MLRDRSKRAKLLFDLGHVTARTKNGTASTVIVPGRRARLHMVILKWPATSRDKTPGVVETECFILAGNQTAAKCKGNLQSVCYHVMAAINLAMDEKGYETSWSESAESARRLKNLHRGGMAFKVVGNGKGLYVTVWMKEDRVIQANPVGEQ